MAEKSVSIRLGTAGKAQVASDFREIGDVGEAQVQRWSKAYDRAGADAEAAAERQARAAAKLAAIVPQTAVQMRINDANSTGYGQYEGSARASAQAFAEIARAEAELTARSRALVAAIDPAFAAQQRFDGEMREARALIAAGGITLDQYCTKLRVETALLEQNAGAHGRANVSVGQLRAGAQQLSFQIGDVAQGFAMGTPLMTIFAQQAGQTVQAVSLMTNATGGFLGFMAGPWGAVLTGAALILGNLISKSYDSANAADAMAAHQKALGDIIDQTTGRIKEQSVALLLNQAIQTQGDIKAKQREVDRARSAILATRQSAPSMGGDSPAVIDADPRIVAAINAFDKSGNADQLAAALGRLKANTPGLKELRANLLGLTQDYTLATREVLKFQAQVRLETGKGRPGDQKLALGQFGPDAPDLSLADAQAKLQAATTARERATAQATITQINARKEFNDGTITLAEYTRRMTEADKVVNASQTHTDRHAQSLARNAAAMRVNASEAIELARAYLIGGDAAIRAEAARKGMTDATRRGIDGDAQTARQLAIMVGDQLVKGAQSVAQLRDETAARAAVSAQIRAGTIDVNDMSRALSDESALRPLLKLQLIAQGDAQAALTDVINAYRKALADAHAEEDRGTALKAIKDAGDRVAEFKAQIADLSSDPATQAINAAARAANRQADDLHLQGGDRQSFLDAQAEQARAAAALDRARYFDQTFRQQANDNEMTQAQIALLGVTADKREVILDHLRREQELKERGIALDSEEGRALLDQGDALEANRIKLQAMGRDLDEVRQFGDKLVDDVLNPENWTSFGDVAHMVLKDIEAELLKLLLLNPIKNWLSGENNTTGGGFFSSLGSLFGGGGGGGDGGIGSILKDVGNMSFGKNATGTENWSGGMTWLAENGPELVNLPRGSRVTSAAETRRMMSGNDNAPSGDVHHWHLEGAVVTQDLLDQMNEIGRQSARAGADAGFRATQDLRVRSHGRA